MTKTFMRFPAFIGVLSVVLGCVPVAQADTLVSSETAQAARWRQSVYQQMQHEAKQESTKQKEQTRYEPEQKVNKKK